jgi:exosome complex component RRP42
MARIVDRSIRESKFIDFKKLSIKDGEKVWGVMLDIFAMNDDGNLLDASCIAAVAALKSAKMPKYDEKTERVKFGEWTEKKLPLAKEMPFLMTFHKIGNKIIIDPIVEEEESSDARLSIAISDNKVNAFQKGNEAEFELEELFKTFDEADKKHKEMNRKIEDLIEKATKAEEKEKK